MKETEHDVNKCLHHIQVMQLVLLWQEGSLPLASHASKAVSGGQEEGGFCNSGKNWAWNLGSPEEEGGRQKMKKQGG